MLPRTMYFDDGKLMLLDQRELPHSVQYVACSCAQDVAEAIGTMVVRGAPAIGVAAAYGMAMERSLGGCLGQAAEVLKKSRPTAVNLAWGVDRMLAMPLHTCLLEEAERMLADDVDICRRLGRNGQALLPDECCVITHCNAGALATCGYGTALGVITAAKEAGKKIRVYVDETRPRLQGARLTAFEMEMGGFDYHLICDNMSAAIMASEKIDAVITGADRIAANGDTANKTGTYGLAIGAAYHGVPFYIAAPLSTFDMKSMNGQDIPIEHRDGDEVRRVGQEAIAPHGCPVKNPSFDVTPASLIAGIITEHGVLTSPYGESIKNMVTKHAP